MAKQLKIGQVYKFKYTSDSAPVIIKRPVNIRLTREAFDILASDVSATATKVENAFLERQYELVPYLVSLERQEKLSIARRAKGGRPRKSALEKINDKAVTALKKLYFERGKQVDYYSKKRFAKDFFFRNYNVDKIDFNGRPNTEALLVSKTIGKNGKVIHRFVTFANSKVEKAVFDLLDYTEVDKLVVK